jgi:O-antigen/teichoic acid export membrane protein
MKSEPFAQESLSRKVIRNTVYNSIGRFWGMLVGLFLTPYIIHRIGVDRFGVWAIIGVITGYFGLFDFGVGASFVKYISEFYAKKDYDNINRVVNTGFVFYFILAASVIAASFFLCGPIITLFKIPYRLHGEAVFILMLGVTLFAGANVLSAFSAVQGGLQRMDISNKIGILVSIVNIVGTIFFLEKGWGLRGLMINNAIIFSISSAISMIVAFRILPELKFSPALFDKKTFKMLFGFGYKIQMSTIASLLHFQMDKVFLAYFLNIGCVTFYSVAAQISSKAREVPLLLVSAIFPVASELEARSDKWSLHELYFRSMKYIMLIGVPISLAVIVFAGPFIDLWLGRGFGLAVPTLRILMAGYFFNIMTASGFIILNGIGKPQYGMRSSILATALNLILSIALIIKIGYFGAVIGTALSMVIAASYFIFMANRIIGMSFTEMAVKLLMKPLVAGSIAFVLIWALVRSVGNISWLILAALALLYLAVFGAAILVLRYLDDYDRYLIKRFTHNYAQGPVR